MDNPESLKLQYDALTRQLERMRGMQWHYHDRFFQWMCGTAVVLLGLVLLWQSVLPFALLLVPFVVVTAGVQAAFYLHFVDFARIHARAVEAQLNHLMGKKVLLGSDIESLYFYPFDKPKMAGILFSEPGKFFSIFTVHWMIIWGVLFFGSLSLIYGASIPDFSRDLIWWYVASAIGWAFVNGIYVTWFFMSAKEEKKIALYLDENLGKELA